MFICVYLLMVSIVKHQETFLLLFCHDNITMMNYSNLNTINNGIKTVFENFISKTKAIHLILKMQIVSKMFTKTKTNIVNSN